MNKIDKKLSELKETGRMGLMTHVVVGYPSLEKTESIVRAMAKSGADFVELQIPFSDPLADGPTIMKACEEALQGGVRVSDAFDVAQKLSREILIPLLFMAYYNTVFHYGVERFCKDAKACGICGLIVPDMPIEEEENEGFSKCAAENGLSVIRVISPASTEERLKKNAAVVTDFVYCTARQGITGARTTLDKDLETYLERVRSYFSVPIAVGFGISKREHMQALTGKADVAVVGSAIIDVIHASKDENIEGKVGDFIESLMIH